MSLFFIILGSFSVWIFEIIPLVRNKEKRKEIWYSILMFISLSVSLFVLFGNKETSIAAIIEKIMKAMIKSMKV